MASFQGYALCIGLNSVNPVNYSGWDGQLNACENDARDMINIAKIKGFQDRKILLTKDATKANVQSSLQEIAAKAKKGDLVLLTYSGHGGQLPDRNGDEDDGYDETWALYDYELIDDELYAEFAKFEEGVRIFVLSDSCHSGTIIRLLESHSRSRVAAESTQTQTKGLARSPRVKSIPNGIAHSTYLEHYDYYEPLLTNKSLAAARENIKASVVLISGCQDNQTSSDGESNGLFTETLKFVWNGGNYKGSTSAFHSKILSYMPPTQSPNLDSIGSVTEFLTQPPFTI